MKIFLSGFRLIIFAGPFDELSVREVKSLVVV